MGKRVPVEIQHLSFPTKTAAKAHFRDILNRGRRRLRGQDVEDLKALLSQYKGTEDVTGFSVVQSTENPRNNQFLAHTPRGPMVFSYTHAVDCASLTHTHPTHTRAALRLEVRGQTEAFRAHVFAGARDGYVVCPETGLKTRSKTAHIDHVPPVSFWSLSSAWMDQVGELRVLEVPASNFYGLHDRTLAEAWQRFHYEHAVLRALYFRANLQQSRTSDFDGHTLEEAVALAEGDRLRETIPFALYDPHTEHDPS